MTSVQVFRDKELVPVNVRLAYRGNRNYIHSADIFQALTKLAQERFASDAYLESLVLRRQAAQQIRISFQAELQMIGTFAIRLGGEQVCGSLVETKAEVLDRVPYDESRAADAVVGGFRFAFFTQPVDGYTAFEQLLVLLKAAGGLGRREAWLCKTTLRYPLVETKPLAIRLRLISLRRFYGFDISQNEQLIGEASAYLRTDSNDRDIDL
jgi:hypothetical protein